MTVLEFEAWVSDNYEELASKAAKILQCRDGKHLDLLHDVVEHLLEKPRRLPNGDPFAFLYVAMERRMLDVMGEDASRASREQMASDNIKILGGDAFANLASQHRNLRKRNARLAENGHGLDVANTSFSKDQRYRAKKKDEAASGLLANWLTGPSGNIRWRYQQLRDGRLFDERAVRSLADSMHRASARYRHAGEHGVSYTEFGQEVAR